MATSAVPAIFPPSSVSIKYFSTRQFCLRGDQRTNAGAEPMVGSTPEVWFDDHGLQVATHVGGPPGPGRHGRHGRHAEIGWQRSVWERVLCVWCFFLRSFFRVFFLRKPNMSFFGWNIFWSCILESHVKGSTHRTLDLWNLVLLETLYCTSWWWQLFTPIDSGKIGGSNSDCIICIFFWIGLVQCSTTNHELW